MPRPEKTSNVVEDKSEVALEYVLIGIGAFLLGLLMYRYRDNWGGDFLLAPALLLIVGGLGSVYWGFSRAVKVKEVPSHEVECSYCGFINRLTARPEMDFPCTECSRMVPIEEGVAMPVFQVRCGYCNELNYYSAKTEVLICEKCDREIPIAQEEGKPQKHVPRGFVVQDDPNLYDFILVDTGPKTEELIPVLQHMLALTRAGVKQVISELPAVLLTGITHKKAELLQAQLASHEAKTEFRTSDG